MEEISLIEKVLGRPYGKTPRIVETSIPRDRFNEYIKANGRIPDKDMQAHLFATDEDKGSVYFGKTHTLILPIDDGTETIRAKAWGNEAASLQEVEENILALVIGKVKEYNEEIYLVPEIIRPLDDPNFLTLHKLERHHHILQHGGEHIPTSVSLEDHYETSKVTSGRVKPKGLGGKILDYIRENDTPQGIAIADIADYFAKEDKTDIQLEVIELQADNWIREERTGMYRFSD